MRGTSTHLAMILLFVTLAMLAMTPSPSSAEPVQDGVIDDGEYEHELSTMGGDTVHVVLDGDAIASVPVEVKSVPDHVVLDHNFAISTFMMVAAFGLEGYLVIRRKRNDQR